MFDVDFLKAVGMEAEDFGDEGIGGISVALKI